jgi:hypothetical protein
MQHRASRGNIPLRRSNRRNAVFPGQAEDRLIATGLIANEDVTQSGRLCDRSLSGRRMIVQRATGSSRPLTRVIQEQHE